MLPTRPDARTAVRAIGFLLLGAIGTAALTVGAAGGLADPAHAAVHDVYYALFGPYDSKYVSGLAAITLLTALAGVAPVLAADIVSDRGEHVFWLLGGAFVLPLPVLAALALLFASSAGVGTAVAVAGTALVVPVGLRIGFDVRSGGLPAMVGVIPVVFLVISASIVVSGIEPPPTRIEADEIPSGADGSAAEEQVADFQSVPIVRRDLFSDCHEDRGGRRECELRLDGYEHDRRAIEFLDRRGVVCPSETMESVAERDSFVAVHEGTSYRVRCT